MSDICTVKKSTLDGIAEAIQSKTGESGGMLPSEMAGKILSIPSGGTTVGKFIQIRAYEVTIGQNAVSNVRELVSTLETAAATYNEGVLIGFSAVENLEWDNAVWCCNYRANNSLPSIEGVMRYRNGTLSTVPNSAGYTASVLAGTKYVIYLSKSEGLS